MFIVLGWLAKSASQSSWIRCSDAKCPFVPPGSEVVPSMPIYPPPIDHSDRLKVAAQFVFHDDILPNALKHCSRIATRWGVSVLCAPTGPTQRPSARFEITRTGM